MASNSDIFFERFPLEAILFAKGEKVHFGVGVSHHTGVKLTGDVALFVPTVNFDDATGLVVQVDYLLMSAVILVLNILLSIIKYPATHRNSMVVVLV